MCRLYGFRSSIDSSVHQSLVAAENALGVQSNKHDDGWGLAYYVERFPHLIRNDRQAISDSLFTELSAVVSTRTFLAHIRKATVGEVNVLNCHPFQHGSWTFAHNGEIARFNDCATTRRRVSDLVDPRFRRFILGSTDSEICFFIFLSRLARRVGDIQNPGVNADQVLGALQDTIRGILAVSAPDGNGDQSLLTFLFTNGNLMLGYRRGRELFYSTHKSRCRERETCYAFEPERCESHASDGIVKHLIISSEPVETAQNVWQELADDELVLVGHGMNFRSQRLSS